MKASMSSDGTLTIVADNHVEAYALKQWEHQRKRGNAQLVIKTDHPESHDAQFLQMVDHLKAWQETSMTGPVRPLRRIA